MLFIGGALGYRDFFPLTIGTSMAVSDVALMYQIIRKTVTAHGLIAFVFNVTMIALTRGQARAMRCR